MAANHNDNKRHYLVRLYHYIAGLFTGEPVLPNGPYENDELQPVPNPFPVNVDDPDEEYVGAAGRPSKWNATEFLIVPNGNTALLLDDDHSYVYSWSARRRVFQCRTVETWLHAVPEPFEQCIKQPGEVHNHPTVPYGWWELYVMDARLRLLAAKQKMDVDGGALARGVIQHYLSVVYSLEELPEQQRLLFVRKILSQGKSRYKSCVRWMRMTQWQRVLHQEWGPDERAALHTRGIEAYLMFDHWEQSGHEKKVLVGYNVADYDDGERAGEDDRDQMPQPLPRVAPASPPVAVRVRTPPIVAVNVDDDGSDDDDSGDDGAGNESDNSAGPLVRQRLALDRQRQAAIEVGAVDGNRSDGDLPLNQYAVVGGANRRVPRYDNYDPDEIIVDGEGLVDAATAAVIGGDRVVGAGDDDEPQVEMYILPEARIRYHLSMRSGVISSLPADHEYRETHSLFTVVRTPNGTISPDDRVLIWASREEVQQLEGQRARKRARTE